MKIRRILVIFVSLTMFAACGGGGSDSEQRDPPPPPPPPPPVAPSTPEIISTSQGEFVHSIELQWSDVGDGVTYEISRSETLGESGSTIEVVSELEFLDTPVEPDQYYYYRITACRGTLCSDQSPEKSGYASASMPELVPVFNDVSAYRENSVGADPVCTQGAICAQAVSQVANLWAIGSELRVAFQFDGLARANFASDLYGYICSPFEADTACFERVRDLVLTLARQWTEHGEITFVEGDWDEADVTVAFSPNRGNWSYLGINSRTRKPSMNLGRGGLNQRTVVHEFGHALGFEHEQHSPNNFLVFDETAVVRYFSNMDPPIDAYSQVLFQFDKDLRGLFTSNNYDPESIMQYAIFRDWITNPEACPVQNSPTYCVSSSRELSATDKLGMSILYPRQSQSSVPWAVTHELSSGNGGPWGSWQPRVYCPQDQYVYGFQLRTEPPQGSADDTGANSLRLYCRPKNSTMAGSLIQSHSGFWGNWGAPKYCGGIDLITGFQLRVESPQRDSDDTAANNINMHCSGGYELAGDGTGWGSWGERKYCELNEAVCGMQLKIEGQQGSSGDDTALNDVLLLCCT